MTKYMIRIEVPKGRLQELLNELDAAQEKIRECYSELNNLGVITVTEDTAKDD